jgi:hypothetical protein
MTPLRRRTRDRLALRHLLARRKTAMMGRCQSQPHNSRASRRTLPRVPEMNRDAR